MAIYTESDFQSVKSAYMNLVTGAKAVQASVSGEYVRFSENNIQACKALLAEIAQELGHAPTRALAKPKGRF